MGDGKRIRPAGIEYPGVNVTFFCHDGCGNFLMAKRGQRARDEQGKWDIGAGQIELSRTRLDTLAEEIEQEYKTEILDHIYLGSRELFREQKIDGRTYGTHWLTQDYRVLVNRDLVKNGEPHKLDEIQWFDGAEFIPPDNEVSFSTRDFLKRYWLRLF